MYLGSIIASWAGLILVTIAATEKLKSEGYVMKKNDKNLSERIIDWCKVMVYTAIPLINLAIPLYAIFNFDKTYQKIINSLTEQGKIIKKDNNGTQQEEVEIDIESNDKENSKKYSDLTNEEKLRVLEHEKSILLSEKENLKREDVKPYNDKGAYKKGK